jgi:putative exporter of polyketide antibiotics
VDRTVPRGALLAWGGGAVLLVLGIALVASHYAARSRGEFGWFAYASTPSSFEPTFVIVTTRDLWGVAVAGLGLAFVAAGAGYVLGTRRPADQGPSERG